VATRRKRAEPPQLPQPPWLDTAKLIERYIYPSYARLDAVIELVPARSKRRESELWERCASKEWISAAWITGAGPLFCGACNACGARGVAPSGALDGHKPGCRFERSPSGLSMAAAFAAESQLVTDAEPLAREWRRALEPWGAKPLEYLCWTYEPHPPYLLTGWDGVSDLRESIIRPAVAAAIAARGSPALLYGESLAAGLGSPRDSAWIDAVFTTILTHVRSRKKPSKPRREIDDEGCDLLAFALEGSALWHAAVEADMKVTPYKPKANERRRSPWADMFPPTALLSKRFASLPNPWPPLVALLSTGAQPVGATGASLALNLLPFSHRTIDA
jgi:hypothetical protein